MAAVIFNSFIRPYVLLVEFRHGHGKMAIGSFLPGNLPTYEFYNPTFVAHRFGLGQWHAVKAALSPLTGR